MGTGSLLLLLLLGQCPTGGSCATGQCPPQSSIFRPFQKPTPQPVGFSPCVVNVSSQINATSRSAGLGVIVRQAGVKAHVLTCNHMTSDAPAINGSPSTLLWKSAECDLRLFAVDLPPLRTILPPSRKPATGDTVNWYNEGRGTSGKVKTLLSQEAILVDGKATPGDSGGPVWFADGSLAGILIAHNTNGREMVFVAAFPFWNTLAALMIPAAAPQKPQIIELPAPTVDLSAVNGRIDRLGDALAALEKAINDRPIPTMPEPDSRIDAIQAGLAKVADATGQLSGKIGELEKRPTPAIPPDYGPKFAEIHTAIAGVATQTADSVGTVQKQVAVVEENQGKIGDKIKAAVAEIAPEAGSLLLPAVLTAAGVSIPGAWLAIAGAKLLGGVVGGRKRRREQEQSYAQSPPPMVSPPRIMPQPGQTQPILMPGQDRTENVYIPVPTTDAREEAKRRAERMISQGDANAAAFFLYRDKLADSQTPPTTA